MCVCQEHAGPLHSLRYTRNTAMNDNEDRMRVAARAFRRYNERHAVRLAARCAPLTAGTAEKDHNAMQLTQALHPASGPVQAVLTGQNKNKNKKQINVVGISLASTADARAPVNRASSSASGGLTAELLRAAARQHTRTKQINNKNTRKTPSYLHFCEITNMKVDPRFSPSRVFWFLRSGLIVHSLASRCCFFYSLVFM